VEPEEQAGRRLVVEIDHCVFPDDLLYDIEHNTWSRIDKDGVVTNGVTSLLSALAGRLISAKLKPVGVSIERGQSFGTLESERFVGPIVSTLSGTLVETNQAVVQLPRTINDSPYEKGWIARLRPSRLVSEKGLLSKADESRILLAQRIAELHVRCFKAFPDREMFEIGTECSAVIVRLNDQLATMPVGEVVHLVSDDPTAYVEMVAWNDRSGQSLVDWRKEGRLFHFVVRKVR
jgi:glycine cleavage system H protein